MRLLLLLLSLLIVCVHGECVLKRPIRKLLVCPNDVLPYDMRVFGLSAYSNTPVLDCQQECIFRNNVLNMPCVGFIYRDQHDEEIEKRNTCVFFSCTNLIPAPKSEVVVAILGAECFVSQTPSLAPWSSLPTNAPTQSHPTQSPSFTSPTSSPSTATPTSSPSTATPTVSPTLPTRSPTRGSFQSPSNIPDWAMFDETLFKPIVADASLCMIVRPLYGTRSTVFSNFDGTEIDCLKECQYDNYCGGVIYSSVLNTCTKAIQLETTDDDHLSQAFAIQSRAFTKVNRVVRHYNSFCALWMAEAPCNTDDPLRQCKWGVGDRGYNQNRYTDTGYCGRVRCAKAAASP